jgi:DNA-binding IclR family transcriptional regulator
MLKDPAIVKIPALDRGLDLLEWMANLLEPVTLTQIAQGLGLAVSEVQRPVACLHLRGYLNRSEAGAYSLSGRLAGLAGAYPLHQRLRVAALGPMTEFARRFDESIHICVQDLDSALVLLDVPAVGLVRLSIRQGARLGALETVSGRILLAHGALALPKVKKTMQGTLEKIRLEGFEHSASSKVIGVTDTGVPVFDHAGGILAALTVSSFRMKGDLKVHKNLLPSLKDCSQKITMSL